MDVFLCIIFINVKLLEITTIRFELPDYRNFQEVQERIFLNTFHIIILQMLQYMYMSYKLP